MPAQTVVNIADYRVSTDPEEVIVTYALGSCLGVAAYDPVARVGGVLHFMLANSAVNPEKAAQLPGMFGDTGLNHFTQDLMTLGGSRRNLWVKLAGAASMRGDNGFFNIGKKNLLLAQRFFWKNGILVTGEEVGGELCRTLKLEIDTGLVLLKDSTGEREI
jgi:chemotaxis protein CheD